MNTFFDDNGMLNIDELIAEQPSFIKIMQDGVVTDEELQEQSKRVENILKDIEQSASPEVIEKVRHLLAEISVLVAITQIHASQDCSSEHEEESNDDNTVFHCRECGTEFHKHDVFCAHCGKQITHMDYEN